jgi:repressor of nif and glnA expression
MTDDSMTKAERERVILEFLAEHGLILPLRPLYENLKREKDITFSQRTVKRRLEDLQERRLVNRIDMGTGYWEITEEGRDYLSNLD